MCAVKERLSIWLLPAPPLAADLAGQIRNIAAALSSPPFPPHLTVLGDLRVRREAAQEALVALAGRWAPLALAPRDIETSPRRFEALTVRFLPSALFDRLATALAALLGLPPAPAPRPHLSLAYPLAPLDAARARGLAAGVPLRRQYEFDALALVDPGADRDDWEDVAAWRVSPPSTLTLTLGEA
jgi:hypothetical protein